MKLEGVCGESRDHTVRGMDVDVEGGREDSSLCLVALNRSVFP